jgi:hypothetical protein
MRPSGIGTATALALLLLGGAAARADRRPAPTDPASSAPELAPCVSDEERLAAQPGQRWRAFRRSAVPIPPLLYLSQDRTFVEALFLYWSSTNVEEGTRLRLLVPFLWQSCTPRSRTLVTPVYGQRVDAEGTAGFVGPYFFRRDRLAQTDVLFPLFARMVDAQSATTIGLNFYWHENTRGTHGGLVPLLFWGRERDGSHYTLVPPLVWHWGDRAAERTLVLTSYFARDLFGPDWTYALFPLLFAGRRGDTRFVASPVAAHVRSATSTTTVIGPLYSHRDEHGHDTGVFPLLMHGRRTSGSRYTVSPALLSWHARRSDGDFSTFSLPLLFAHWGGPRDRSLWWLTSYFHRDPDGWSATVFPLYFGGRRGPRHHQAVPPFFAHWGDAEHERTLVLNTYFGRETSTGDYAASFFPLVFAGRTGADSYLLSPLVLSWRNPWESTTIVGPAFHHADALGHDRGLVPLYFQGQSGPRRYRHVPPLLFFDWADEGSRRTIAGPFYRFTGRDAWHTGVVPLWFQGATPTRRYAVSPLLPFWYLREGGRRLLVVGPFYHDRVPDGWHAGLVPLYFGGRTKSGFYHLAPLALTFDWGDREERTTIFPLGYRHRAPGAHDFGIVPLYFEHRRGRARVVIVPPLLSARWEEGETRGLVALGLLYRFADRDAHHRGLVPLYFAGDTNQRSVPGPSSYRLILPPLLMRLRSPTGATTVAGPFFRWSEERERHFGLLPLYFGGRGLGDGSGRYDHVLPPVVWSWGDRDERTLVVGTFYDRVRRYGRDTGLVPLWFRGRDSLRGSYYDLVLPLFGRFGDRDETTLWAGPFYSTADPRARHVGVVPLYFGGRRHWPDLSAYDHVLPPLFMHWRDPTSQTTILLPGFVRTGRGGYDVGLLPVFFHGRHDEDGRHYTHLAPLFWHWGDARQSRTLVVPLAYHARTDEESLFVSPLVVAHTDRLLGKQRLVVFPFLWRFASPDSEVNVGFPLWWDFHARGRPDRLTILVPFGFRRERADETTTMVLNVLVLRGRGAHADAWTVHVFPLLEVARYNPAHLKWQVLLGLVGHERQGRMGRWRVAYVWTEPR